MNEVVRVRFSCIALQLFWNTGEVARSRSHVRLALIDRFRAECLELWVLSELGPEIPTGFFEAVVRDRNVLRVGP